MSRGGLTPHAGESVYLCVQEKASVCNSKRHRQMRLCACAERRLAGPSTAAEGSLGCALPLTWLQKYATDGSEKSLPSSVFVFPSAGQRALFKKESCHLARWQRKKKARPLEFCILVEITVSLFPGSHPEPWHAM